MAEYAIDPKTGQVVVVDSRKGQTRDNSTGTTSTGTTAPPTSVLTAQQQADARNSIASGGRSITGQPMGNFLSRGGLSSRGVNYRYSRGRVEEAFRRYDEIMAAKAAGRPHPLMMDLLMGANQYWQDLGFASERGGPGGRGFFDKAKAQEYIRNKFGPNSWTDKPVTVAQDSQSSTVQNAIASTARTEPFADDASSSTTDSRPEPFATTQNQAGPGTAAAQAPSGQQGATTNTTPTSPTEQQNQETQFRSSRTGFSGNRRFHPFGG